jgi:hypothetical protein
MLLTPPLKMNDISVKWFTLKKIIFELVLIFYFGLILVLWTVFLGN